MIDSQKLDALFEDKTNYKPRAKQNATEFSWRRLFKITLPCLAAVLLGLMAIIPNIKKSVDVADTVTIPHKGEMEKLHIKNTEFNLTDSKNRVNNIVAADVSEIEADSKRYKIIEPKGKIPTDDGVINITSKIGYFNQNNNILELEDKVTALVNGTTTINTAFATYDFTAEKGWGNVDVFADGDWGNLQANGFVYDKNAALLTLKGNHQINTEKWSLRATEKSLFYQNENKTVSLKNAEFTQDGKTLFADKIIAYFSADKKRELRRIETFGNVRIITPEEKIYAQKGEYNVADGKIIIFGTSNSAKFMPKDVKIIKGDNKLLARQVEIYLTEQNTIKSATALGAVRVYTPKGSATGNKGVYNPQTNTVDLFDNVTIEQNGNYVKGTHAQTDLNTSISKISGNKTSTGRVHGTFYKKRKQENGENAKK